MSCGAVVSKGWFFGAALVALTGCAGTGSGAPPDGAARLAVPVTKSATSSDTLTTKPRSVDFRSGNPETVTILGGTPPYFVKQSNPEIADVSNARRRGGAWIFLVRAVAGGATTITVTDSRGATADVPAEQPACLPPVPEITLHFPRPGSDGVLQTIGRVVMETPRSAANQHMIPEYYVRLDGSDGSAIVGSFLRQVKSPPQEAYWRASIPTLKPGITYDAQVANPRLVCLPPVVAGHFTTYGF